MIRVQVKKKLHASQGILSLDVDFELTGGELITLFGESGAGKTTILRMIAGLTQPEEGLIEVDGDVWFNSRKGINWPAQKRKAGFVFQECNLFPHMTVEENLRFAVPCNDFELMDELLEVMHLTEFKNHRPQHLSGGQKQRVALIRALLRQPKIFLLDEPLSSLDLELRLRLQDEILELYKRFQIPTIFVSHDLSEVFKLSSRILLLENGKIKKSGHPEGFFAGQMISGKFKFVGTILDIKEEEFIFIVTVQIGNHLTKVVATKEEIKNMRLGDKVMIAAKAFNPIILKHSF